VVQVTGDETVVRNANGSVALTGGPFGEGSGTVVEAGLRPEVPEPIGQEDLSRLRQPFLF
jgi:hypothetical protein